MKYSKILFTTLLLFPVLIFSQEQNDTSYVALKTGEKVYGNIEFHSPIFGKNYISVDDTVKYYLKEVDSYQIKENYFAVIDGEVARRTHRGRLDTFLAVKYSFTAGTMHTINTPYGGSFTTGTPPSFVDQSVTYFSKNGAPIKEADYDNLREALADNAESMDILNTYNTLSYVKWGGYIIGGGAFLAGLASMKKDDPGPNAGIIGGAVIMGAAYLIHIIQKPKLQKAIDVYNR